MEINKKFLELVNEDMATKYWRPAMAWQYLIVCLFDFMFMPFFHQIFELIAQIPLTEWKPITLQYGGLYHMIMGSILGIYIVGRTIEKVNLANKTAEIIKTNDKLNNGAPATSSFI